MGLRCQGSQWEPLYPEAAWDLVPLWLQHVSASQLPSPAPVGALKSGSFTPQHARMGGAPSGCCYFCVWDETQVSVVLRQPALTTVSDCIDQLNPLMGLQGG